jgi:tetratricopeptide (TPR) repeat protein
VRRTPQDPHFGELLELLRKGNEYQANRHYRSLSRLQAELLQRIDQYSKNVPSRSMSRSDIANQVNNLAWNMATTPDPDGVNGPDAAALAAKATGLMPGEGTIWNTLGVAYYRAGDAEAAEAALQRSMDLRDGGDSFDWFFLAMIHHDAGEPETARLWYDRAVNWMKAYRPGDVELHRFRAESATCLNIDDAEARTSLPDPPLRTRFRGGPRGRFQP